MRSGRTVRSGRIVSSSPRCGRIALALASFLVGSPGAAFAQDRQPAPTVSSTNLAFLLGTGWEGPGRTTRDVLTFEHSTSWEFGDTFVFFDLSHLTTRRAGDRGPGTLIYAEVQPRFSLGRLLDACLCAGPIADVLTAHEVNVSGTGSLAHLHGLGLAWRIPGGGLKTNLYLRDNRDLEGVTWQILVAGLVRFELAGQQLTVGGFTDFIGREETAAANIFSAIQLLWDVGTPHRRLFAGVEFHTSINHLGTDGLNEFVPQAMLKWVF